MTTQRSARQKGRNFEKRVCLILRDAFGLTDDDIWPAPASVPGMDIKLSKVGRETVGLAVECKNVKSLNVWQALEQAKRNTPDGMEPALIFHRSIAGNQEIWIVVRLPHYLKVRLNG